jgi:[protein-PII] uridylyltransferase
MLLLHTFADANATSSKMWNGFKDALLWDLFQKTERLLSGATDFLRVEEKRRELLADEAQRGLPASFPEDELRAHFSSLPARYFQSHSAGEIATDLLMAHRFMKQQAGEALEALAPVVEWKDEPDRGYTSGRVCTWDRPGLFSRITGSFSAAGINILGAQVFTRTDGIALDTFFVTDGHTGGPVAVTDRQQFETVLRRALSGQDVDFPALMTRHRSARPLYQSLEDERIQTRLHFDNATSENRTIIDLETEDRLGLLYAISQVFSELGLDISLAKISTEQGAASDSFYVTGAGGSKLQDLAQQKLIGERLRAAIAALDPPAKAKR